MCVGGEEGVHYLWVSGVGLGVGPCGDQSVLIGALGLHRLQPRQAGGLQNRLPPPPAWQGLAFLLH